jgi:hypothetical protein
VPGDEDLGEAGHLMEREVPGLPRSLRVQRHGVPVAAQTQVADDLALQFAAVSQSLTVLGRRDLSDAGLRVVPDAATDSGAAAVTGHR